MQGKPQLIQGDCLVEMSDIPDKSIDMILCDLPYGTTACKWDVVIPFAKLWEHYERVIKDNGAICLFGNEPFSSYLRLSNLKLYKYDWKWKKSKSVGFVHAKNKPLEYTELIAVFSKAPIGHVSQLGNKRMEYNPQGLVKKKSLRKNKIRQTKNSEHLYIRKSHKDTIVSEFTNYPQSVLDFENASNHTDVRGLHPTQKPVALLEYLIKTYTNEGETVLDNTMGSGSTGVAAVNLGRLFIGIEKDPYYYLVAEARINKDEETLQILKENKEEIIKDLTKHP